MYFATDLFYDKGLHVKSLVHDKSGALSEEIEHYYKGSRCVKTITYAYIGDAKYVKETTYYLTDNESDYVTVGISGDTTAFTKTMEESHGKTVLHYTRELDVQDIWYYSNGGQLVVAVMLDIKAGERTVSKYIYDLKGNVIEEITYRERLTHGTI